MASGCKWFTVLVVLIGSLQTVPAKMAFRNPPSGLYNEDYGNNSVYAIGDVVQVSWTDGPKHSLSSVTLWQIDPATRQWMKGEQGEYLILSAKNVNRHTWIVATNKNLTESNVFYLALFQEGRSTPDNTTHAFNLTRAKSDQEEDMYFPHKDGIGKDASRIELGCTGKDGTANQNEQETNQVAASIITGKIRIGGIKVHDQNDGETQDAGVAVTPTSYTGVDEVESRKSIETDPHNEATPSAEPNRHTIDEHGPNNVDGDDEDEEANDKTKKLETGDSEKPDNKLMNPSGNAADISGNSSGALSAGAIAAIAIGAMLIASTAAFISRCLIMRNRNVSKLADPTEQYETPSLDDYKHETRHPFEFYGNRRVQPVSSQQYYFELEGNNDYRAGQEHGLSV